MNSTVDQHATSITPHGVSLATLVLSLVFAPTTTIVVALRCGIRTKQGLFRTEDGLMLVGWVDTCALLFDPLVNSGGDALRSSLLSTPA